MSLREDPAPGACCEIYRNSSQNQRWNSHGRLKADAFHLGKRAEDREDRIIYDKVTGNLFYDQDGTGSSGQIKIAVLTNKAKVVLGDFHVI